MIFVNSNKSYFEKQKFTFFEMSVALAFWYFNKVKVDYAIIEVGLGGRLDATNIITPVLSIITNIGLDHTQFLGKTHKKIALEKQELSRMSSIIIGEKDINRKILKTRRKLKAPLYLPKTKKFLLGPKRILSKKYSNSNYLLNQLPILI